MRDEPKSLTLVCTFYLSIMAEEQADGQKERDRGETRQDDKRNRQTDTKWTSLGINLVIKFVP